MTGTEQMRDAARFQYLQNSPVQVAQAYFWNYSSRRQRAAAIDEDMAELALRQPAAAPPSRNAQAK